MSSSSYSDLAIWYEQQIANNPDNKINYWHLGLLLLNQGNLEEAQATWLMGMAGGESEELEQWQSQLVDILETEAKKYRGVNKLAEELRIREQILEFCPDNIDNLLQIILLLTLLDNYVESTATDFNLTNLLTSKEVTPEQVTLLIDILHLILSKHFGLPSTIHLVKLASDLVKDPEERTKLVKILQLAIQNIALQNSQPYIAVPIGEIALELDPENYTTILLLTHTYSNTDKSEKCIDSAKKLYDIATNLPVKIHAQKYILRGLILSARSWSETLMAVAELERLILELEEDSPEQVDRNDALLCLTASFPFAYFRDRPRENRLLINKVSGFFYNQVQRYSEQQIRDFTLKHRERFSRLTSERPLKIGYLSHTFLSHSVGWLARWLFVHHDRKNFDIHAYSLCCNPEHDPMHIWFTQNVPKMWKSNDTYLMAEQIC